MSGATRVSGLRKVHNARNVRNAPRKVMCPPLPDIRAAARRAAEGGYGILRETRGRCAALEGEDRGAVCA